MPNHPIMDNLTWTLRKVKAIEWRESGAFHNGVFVAGTYRDTVILNLAKKDRDSAITYGAQVVTDGPVPELTALPVTFATDPDCLQSWIGSALQHVKKADRGHPLPAFLAAAGPLIGTPCHGSFRDGYGALQSRNLLIFAAETVDDEFSDLLADVFGDGFVPGYLSERNGAMRWKQKRQRPFALATMAPIAPDAGLADVDDIDHLLLADLDTGCVLGITIDGTALRQKPHAAADSISDMQLAPGNRPR